MATTQFKIEVENSKKYKILKEIQNYYSDYVNNPMARTEEVLEIEEIVKEVFSEEGNGLSNFLVKYYDDDKEIDFDTLKKAYELFCLEQTSVIEPSKWIGDGRRK